MTFLYTDDVIQQREQLDDGQIIEKCTHLLKQMFSLEVGINFCIGVCHFVLSMNLTVSNLQDAPEVVNFSVSRWSKDHLSGMSYSFLPIGSNGECFDEIFAPIANKVFFAGEVIQIRFLYS